MRLLQRHFQLFRTLSFLGILGACTESSGPPIGPSTGIDSSKIPITTKHPRARALFLEGRDLAERLRATDAREKFQEAVALDPNLALAHLGLATTAPSPQQFFDALKTAVFVSAQVSRGEQLMIEGLQAAADSDSATQLGNYDQLVEMYPNDERAHHLRATLLFGRQEFDRAIAGFERAIAINSEFSPPYNLLGYSFRSLDRYDEAEIAFEKYISLLPDEPNPYDSYAELLMKVGRFEESIDSYQTALTKDPTFVASHIGIGMNHILLGQFEAARTSFERLEQNARNSGQRRQAVFWNALSFIHEQKFESAIDSVTEMMDLAAASGDLLALSGDHVLQAQIWFARDDSERAEAHLAKAVELTESADVSAEVKQAQVRNQHFFRARFATESGGLETARARVAEFQTSLPDRPTPFDRRRSRELSGALLIAEDQFDEAARELAEGNQQDPRIFLLQAKALLGAGNQQRAIERAHTAAHFNGLSPSYAFVRRPALDFLASQNSQSAKLAGR